MSCTFTAHPKQLAQKRLVLFLFRYSVHLVKIRLISLLPMRTISFACFGKPNELFAGACNFQRITDCEGQSHFVTFITSRGGFVCTVTTAAWEIRSIPRSGHLQVTAYVVP